MVIVWGKLNVSDLLILNPVTTGKYSLKMNSN